MTAEEAAQTYILWNKNHQNWNLETGIGLNEVEESQDILWIQDIFIRDAWVDGCQIQTNYKVVKPGPHKQLSTLELMNRRV